jgi:hypothetical protein
LRDPDVESDGRDVFDHGGASDGGVGQRAPLWLDEATKASDAARKR